MLVVFYHIQKYISPYVNESVNAFLSHGYLAVDFFFILSGFVIGFNYFDRLIKLEKEAVFHFYIKRIARIYPLHLIVLLGYLSIPVAYLITGRGFSFSGQFSIEGFVSGLFLIQTWGWLEDITWNIPSWSISTEMMAYILFPAMVFSLNYIVKLFGEKGVVVSAFLSMALIIFIFRGLGEKDIGESIQALGAIRCVFEFLSGVCIWLIYHNYKNSLIKLATPLFLGGIFLFIVCTYLGVANYYFVPLSMVMVLTGSISHQNIITHFFSTRVLIWLGNISYSVYLTHYLIRDWFKLLFLDSPSASLIWISSYVLTVIVVSHFLYKYFEMPAKNFVLHTFIQKEKGKKCSS